VFFVGLFVVSLFVGGETKSASVEKDKFSGSLDGKGFDVYYFYGQGCPHCAKVEPFLAEMKQKYLFKLHKYDIYTDREYLSLFDEYCNRYGLPLGRRGVPTVFVSSTYFVGDTPILESFEKVVEKALQESSSIEQVEISEGSKQVQGTSEGGGKVCDSEKSNDLGCLSLLAITVAALVDSISPCSIAILVFLIGARVLVANQKKRALKVGLSFCLSVFIAYLLFGLGLLTVIQVAGFSGIFSLLVGLFALLAGIFYLKDVFWYGRGGFTMEVPRSLKPLLMKMLKCVTSPSGAFAMGFVVVCFELPCTGGPYLFILGQLANSVTRLQAIPWLLYYNFIFVSPLTMISLLLYSNLFSIGKVREWNDKNKRLLRLVGGFAMMALGFLVMPASQMLQLVSIFLRCFKVVGPSVLTTISLYLVVSFGKQKSLRRKLTRIPGRGFLLVSLIVSPVFIVSGSANFLLGQSSVVSRAHASSCVVSGTEEQTSAGGVVRAPSSLGLLIEDASNVLVNHGFKNAYNMLGGINAWTDAGFSVMSDTLSSLSSDVCCNCTGGKWAQSASAVQCPTECAYLGESYEGQNYPLREGATCGEHCSEDGSTCYTVDQELCDTTARDQEAICIETTYFKCNPPIWLRCSFWSECCNCDNWPTYPGDTRNCWCAGPGETACADGVDNDNDGQTDCNDPDCEGQTCVGSICCFYGCGETSCGGSCMECCKNADCPIGQKCCDGYCQECCTDADCGPGESCVGGTCQPSVPEFPLGSVMYIAAIPLLFYIWWRRKHRKLQ